MAALGTLIEGVAALNRSARIFLISRLIGGRDSRATLAALALRFFIRGGDTSDASLALATISACV